MNKNQVKFLALLAVTYFLVMLLGAIPAVMIGIAGIDVLYGTQSNESA